MKSIFCLLLLLIFLNGCGEIIEDQYPTLKEAATEIEQGWIPKFLPSSSKNIREVHDLDTNRGIITFVFDASEADTFTGRLKAVPKNQLSQIECPVAPRKSWWPEFLEAGRLSAAVEGQKLDVYEFGNDASGRIKDGKIQKCFIVIDRKNSRAFIWY
jgi:hypothetical protein